MGDRFCAGIGPFNPTLVRLRLLEQRVSAITSSAFNPTLVRLRPAGAVVALAATLYLSIPRWFD